MAQVAGSQNPDDNLRRRRLDSWDPPSAGDCFRIGLPSIPVHADPQSGTVQRTICTSSYRRTHRLQFVMPQRKSDVESSKAMV